MAWFFLLLAGLFEVVWATGLKYSENFTKLVPTIITAIAIVLSLWFLSLSFKSLPMGTAYAVWTGIGTLGAALVGIIFFGESVTTLRLVSFALIVLGIVGLKLAS